MLKLKDIGRKRTDSQRKMGKNGFFDSCRLKRKKGSQVSIGYAKTRWEAGKNRKWQKRDSFGLKGRFEERIQNVMQKARFWYFCARTLDFCLHESTSVGFNFLTTPFQGWKWGSDFFWWEFRSIQQLWRFRTKKNGYLTQKSTEEGVNENMGRKGRRKGCQRKAYKPQTAQKVMLDG